MRCAHGVWTQASVILQFSSQEEWQLPDLAAQLESSVAAVKKLVRFWTDRGAHSRKVSLVRGSYEEAAIV